jgi:hypothetical protein
VGVVSQPVHLGAALLAKIHITSAAATTVVVQGAAPVVSGLLQIRLGHGETAGEGHIVLLLFLFHETPSLVRYRGESGCIAAASASSTAKGSRGIHAGSLLLVASPHWHWHWHWHLHWQYHRWQRHHDIASTRTRQPLAARAGAQTGIIHQTCSLASGAASATATAVGGTTGSIFRPVGAVVNQFLIHLAAGGGASSPGRKVVHLHWLQKS